MITVLSAGVVTPVGSTATVTGTITNNTSDTLVFNTLIQFLAIGGVDVVTPISGPSVTVTSGTTSAPFVVNLPALPDGYLRVAITGLGTTVGSTAEYSVGSEDYLKVVGGVPTVISFGEWYENTGGSILEEI